MLKTTILKLITKLLDPNLKPSYSQFGEDILIEAIFHGKSKGYYVDVGCNHPTSYSNTWKLYLTGWSGIAIDPNPRLIEQYKKARPRDIVIQKAVSSRKEIVDFYFSKISNLTSGIGKNSSGAWARNNENCHVVKLETTTLSEVLRENNTPPLFDLLSIDVEGGEISVLESMDFEIFKPSVILIEIHNFLISHPENDPVYRKLVFHGYQLKSYSNPTALFVTDLSAKPSEAPFEFRYIRTDFIP